MNEASSTPHVKAGKLTLLAVSYPRRSDLFPGVPTLTESGYPNIDGNSWFGIYGMRGAPPAVFEALNAKLVEIGRTAEMKARLQTASAELTPQTLDEVGKHLADEARQTLAVVKAANIRME
jgi:tripartite-type tricarboxylate transporter receptor subunit TctC